MRSLLAIAIALVAACGTSSDTRIHLVVSSAPALAVDHYQLLLGEHGTVAESLPELDVEVPAELAGAAQTLDVWGLDATAQVAFGTTSVTPILDSTITAMVTLAAVSCGTPCTLGATQCSGSGTSTCEAVGSCLAWSAAVACPSGDTCSDGACVAAPSCAQTCTSAPANADPTCNADGTCGFTCHSNYVRSGSSCVPMTTGSSKIAFYTSAVYSTANLGGLAGADLKCQNLASAAGLTGTFKAWMSDKTHDATARLSHSTAPYVLVDGTVVASSWTQLVSGTLSSPISEDEHGVVEGVGAAWTGTSFDGTYSGNDCADWTSGSSANLGDAGQSNVADNTWSSHEVIACNVSGVSLYCLEQ